MSDAVILETRDLSVTFGGLVAVKKISVKIGRGEIVGLIGTNGAGKTTFLNMVTGYLKPTEGSVVFDGEVIVDGTPRGMVRRGMARSFQIPQIFPEMTVLDHIMLSLALAQRTGTRLRALESRTRADATAEVLSRFGLETIAHRPMSVVPQGQRKLVDIAMAMTLRPKLLLLDEPTSGVSSAEKIALMDVVFAAIRADAITVLFVEHDMEIVKRYVTRIMAFRDGYLIADGDPDEVMQAADVSSAIIRNATPIETKAIS